MGNFHQHVSWSMTTVVFIQVILLYLFLVYAGPIHDILSAVSASTGAAAFLALLTIPIVFIIGAVSPDMELPKESRETDIIGQYFFPILTGIAIGFAVYKGIKIVLSTLSVTLPVQYAPVIIAIIAGIFGIILVFVIVFLTDKYAMHWGHLHSVGAAILVSLLVMGSAMVFWGIPWGFLIGLSYFGGYLNHITCDQFYHDLRDKKWAGGPQRYALNLCLNRLLLDPLIIFDNLTGALRNFYSIKPHRKQKEETHKSEGTHNNKPKHETTKHETTHTKK